MFPPHSEDADQEGEGGHDHLPGLGGAELTMTPKYFPHARGEHDGDTSDQGGGASGLGGQGTAHLVSRRGSETKYT